MALGAEQEALDFKATLDFANPKHQVEHVKDLLALMSLPAGGYIVVGVRNDGSLATEHQKSLRLTSTKQSSMPRSPHT